MNSNTRLFKILIFIVFVVSVILLVYRFVPNFSSGGLNDKVELTLYFSTPDAMYLQGEKREIEKSNIYQNTMNELIVGPNDSNLHRTIPENTKILDIEIEDKIAKLNFNNAIIEEHWGGSTGERLTVYSIVNTMTQFEEIDKVFFLIEGETVESLAGHMDLSIALEKNIDIIKN